MNHEHLSELMASYALGVLDGDDLRAVEGHLAEGCTECEAELRALTGAVESLAASVEPVEPSEMTRARTLAAIEHRPAAAAQVSAGWRLAAAAALALLVWTGWSSFDLRRQVRTLAGDRDGLSRELALVRDDLSATRTELARAQLANRIISAPRTASVLLAGLNAAPDSSARTYVDPSTNRAVFYAANLEPLSEDQTYQLWFIADGTPISGGVFSVDEQGSGSIVVDNVASADSLEAWAVTVEPAGGVPQPTGTMVLLGSVT
ncbi:MAG: anti-sigma factor domain-containing protein [Thermoanaerobaculia bacterium]